ncbi:MAG: phosphoglucomutase/phosphomannomutase family protein [Actinobacteria bacterium]|nr:phosphoglucomutase/phosphomannomutase family protein [Actinomycetota bacterium]
MKTINFGTDGWRSTIDEDFNRENVLLVSRSIGRYLSSKGDSKKGCVVAYDTRKGSKEYADLIADVLVENGINTYLMETFCPTPMAAYAVKLLDAAGAVMLTASHNPPDYNGIKFIPEYAGPATVEITSSIEREIKEIGENGYARDNKIESGKLNIVDVSTEYIKHLLELVNDSGSDLSKVKVTFDPMYGAGQNVMLRALHYLDCKAIPLHCYVDPGFGGILPEPVEENLKECKKAVLENGADLGIALDGDADRFGLIDSKGIYLSPNEAMTLVLWYMLSVKGERGAVARTVATTHMLDKIANKYDCEVIETPVGFKYIGEAMRSGDVIFGGEESGGLSIRGHVPEKDGLLADLMLINIASHFKKPLSEVLREIFNELGTCYGERIDLSIPEDDKQKILDKLKKEPPEKLGGETVVETNFGDGAKLITDKGNWVLFRASGTEPLMRTYIEADSKEAFDNIRESALIIIRGR